MATAKKDVTRKFSKNDLDKVPEIIYPLPVGFDGTIKIYPASIGFSTRSRRSMTFCTVVSGIEKKGICELPRVFRLTTSFITDLESMGSKRDRVAYARALHVLPSLVEAKYRQLCRANEKQMEADELKDLHGTAKRLGYKLVELELGKKAKEV